MQQAAKLLQEPFHPVSKQLRVSKEGDAEFKVEVLACSPGVYKCEVRFLNEDIGEFVVEVVAKVSREQPVSVMSACAKSLVASLLVKVRATAAGAVVAPLATVPDVMVMVGTVSSKVHE